MRRSRSGWCAAAEIAVIGVDDDYCRKIAPRPKDAAGRPQRGNPRLGEARSRRGDLLRRRAARSLARAAAPIERRRSRRQRARCAARTMARTPPSRYAAARALWRFDARRSSSRPCTFPGLAAPHGGGRPTGTRAVHQRFQGDQRRRRRQALSSFRRHLSGLSAAGRRRAASSRSRPLFPRMAKAYLIGEASEDFAQTLGGAVAFSAAATLERRLEAAAPTPLRAPRTSRSCCCRRPAPRSTSSPISKCAARRSATPSPTARPSERILEGATHDVACRTRPFADWWRTVDRWLLGALVT